MFVHGLYFLIGLAGLYFGAEWLVAGAARLARRLGMRPVVVGLTVVAFGSSAPELLVGVVASVGGQSEVVLGNVLGSNILNVALILGVAAMVRPLRVGLRLLSREIPLMVVFTVLVVGLMLGGMVGRPQAVILLVVFAMFIAYVLWAARQEQAMESEPGVEAVVMPGSGWGDVVLIALGLGGLVVGAHLLVVSSVFFALILGVSEVVIGITIVAIGTSLPELATCVVAALRSEPDIAIGNAVGSNIFNILPILGIAALIRPIPVRSELLEFEIPAMLLFAAVLLPLAWRGRVLGRGSGLLLLIGYLVFTGMLAARVLG